MNTAEYNKCVEMYADAIFRFIVKQLRDDFESENIVQNSFEKLWIRRDEISFDKAKAFLFKTAYNNMIDEIRKKSRTLLIEEEMDFSSDISSEYKNIKEVLELALSKLPPIQKSVVLLRDYEGYSYEEIAGITGLNESQVKVYIFRARTALKSFIGRPEAVI